jgi:hypothetical protein
MPTIERRLIALLLATLAGCEAEAPEFVGD